MKFECIECKESCVLESSKYPSHCILGESTRSSKWHPATAPKPLSEAILPKLTAAVFDRDDCPEWAQWAGVNQDGTASFFGNVPNRGCSNPRKNYWSYHYSEMKQIPGNFDSSDWQHSLIKRPEKEKEVSKEDVEKFVKNNLNQGYLLVNGELKPMEPKLLDWVKVGAWVWCADCRAERKIEAINGNRITVRFPDPDATPYTGDMSEFKPIVPFTFETIAPLLPFAVMASKTFVNTIIGATEKGVYFSAATEVTSYDDLLYFCTRLDGSPCGVAEVGR